MNSFADFCEYLVQKAEAEPENLPKAMHVYMMDKLSPESFSSFMENYAKDVQAYTNDLIIYYLSVYHEWLSQSS